MHSKWLTSFRRLFLKSLLSLILIPITRVTSNLITPKQGILRVKREDLIVKRKKRQLKTIFKKKKKSLKNKKSLKRKRTKK